MTIGEILRACIDTAPVQLVHECLVGARAVRAKRRENIPAHTRLEIATQQFTPDDAMYYSGALGRPTSRKPEYIGVIVWVPRATWEEMADK